MSTRVAGLSGESARTCGAHCHIRPLWKRVVAVVVVVVAVVAAVAVAAAVAVGAVDAEALAIFVEIFVTMALG